MSASASAGTATNGLNPLIASLGDCITATNESLCHREMEDVTLSGGQEQRLPLVCPMNQSRSINDAAKVSRVHTHASRSRGHFHDECMDG